jgi:hypothetical protein
MDVWSMGIQNRDYMKRASDERGGPFSSPDDKVEAFLGNFVHKHRRLLIYSGIALAVLIIVAVAIALLS